MTYYSISAIVALTVSLTSCVTPQQIMKERVNAIPETKRAYVLGRYTVECEPTRNDCRQEFNSLTVNYRSTTSDFFGFLDSTHGSIFGHDTVYDFVDPSRREKGYYFCEVVPAEAFAFFSYRFWNFAGGGSGYSVREESYFNLPFSLAPGEIVYVGRLKLTTAKGKNMFGMSLPTPGILLLSENQTDIASALQKCPANIRTRSVRNAPLKIPAQNPSPLVGEEGNN